MEEKKEMEKVNINNFNEESLIYDHTKINYQHIKDFDFMVIKNNNIEGLNMQDPGFLTKIINSDYIEIVNTKSDEFINSIHTNLKMNEFEEQDMAVVTHIIYEELNYMYEIMFLQVLSDKRTLKENNNDLSNIININDEDVFGNMIITKTFVNPENNEMYFSNMTKNDLYNMLNSRVNQKCIVYEDDNFREEIITGDLFENNKHIFGDDHVDNIEIPFFNHNLNIAYVKSDYGEKIFPNLIKSKIDVAIIYTKINDRYRGNLTMTEFNMIKKIMDKTSNYTTDKEWMNEEKDEYDRIIHKNKYRILYRAFNDIINKD